MSRPNPTAARVQTVRIQTARVRTACIGLSFFAAAAVLATASTADAQWPSSISANSGVDVGPGHAGATAGANGQWQHAKTKTHVGDNGRFAQGLAVGAGPNGLAVSHSIGGNAGGVGLGHNLNLSIGRGGTHFSHGGVQSSGGNSRIIAGGGTTQGGIGNVNGGSTVGGFGNRTRTWTRAATRLWK